MPIINGFFSVWNLAYISVPTNVTNPDSRISWTNPAISVVRGLEIKQVSTMGTADGVNKGSPYGHLWKSEDTIWQTDITIPFLVPAHDQFTTPAGQVTNPNLPLCANLPVEDFGMGYLTSKVTSRFLWCALSSMWGHDTGITSFRSREWAGGFDGVIQKCSIQADDGGSTLSITILSSDDPRQHFYLTTKLPAQNTISTMRVARAWDFAIPMDLEIIGSPYTKYEPVTGDVPNRMPNPSASLDGLPSMTISGAPIPVNSGRYVALRSLSLSVESSVDRIPSAGVGSSRPIFAVKSIKSSGSIDMIPYVVWDNGGSQAVSLSLIDAKPPEGWVVDAQSLEEIGRYGGQFFVTGRPNYRGNAKPLYFEVGMRDGLPPNPLDPKYMLINRYSLGPINIAILSLRPQPGDTNVIHVEFNTSPNVNVTSPNAFNTSVHLNNTFPPV